MKKSAGFVSVSFRGCTPEIIVASAKKAGLSFIEWGSDIHAPCDDKKRLEGIVELQKKHGILCCSYGTYFRLGTTDMDELERYISAAKILGTDILRVWCGDRNKASYGNDDKKELFAECKMAADIAERLGVVLCMECHNNTYTETIDGAIELMNEVNSENFRMYWQPNQFVSLETNLKYAENIAPFTKCIHVFNWKEQNKYPLCEGMEIWKKYMSFFDKDTLPLLEFMHDDRIESLQNEAEALFGILG